MLNRIIIIKPLITERSLIQAGHNDYTFLVDLKATKFEIKKAIEILYKVKVLKVRTIIIKGKTHRSGKKRTETNGTARKKAIITLPSDQKLEVFETGEK